MRILLDNCVPVDFATHLRGQDVATAVGMQWAHLDDNDLLDAMAGQFDVLVTVDKNIPFQQSLNNRPIAIIILHARSNRVAELARLVAKLRRVLRSIGPGELREIS